MKRDTITDDPLHRWLVAMESGSLDAAEQEAFDRWLGDDDDRRRRLAELGSVWFGSVAYAPEISRIRTSSNGHAAARLRKWIGGAVSAVALVVAAMILPDLVRSYVYDFAVPRGSQVKHGELQDGTQYAIAPSTVVDVEFSQNRRLVTLHKGRLWLDVTSNRDRPLHVEASGGRIIVTGTTFSARADEGSLVVALVEGAVQLESGGDVRDVVPGEVWRASPTAIVQGVRTVPEETAWTDGALVFRKMPVRELLAEVEPFLGGHLVYTGRDAVLVSAVVRLEHLSVDLEKVLIEAGLSITRVGGLWWIGED